MQRSISNKALLCYLEQNTNVSRETLEASTPLELVQTSLQPLMGYIGEYTAKYVAFVVLASFNLAKASEIFDVNIPAEGIKIN